MLDAVGGHRHELLPGAQSERTAEVAGIVAGKPEPAVHDRAVAYEDPDHRSDPSAAGHTRRTSIVVN